MALEKVTKRLNSFCPVYFMLRRISEFSEFLKISGLCQKHAVPRNLLEKLGEVVKNNFLTAM